MKDLLMLLTDVFPHTILPKNCLPAVACSVFHIYTIYKSCKGEERYHSGVGGERKNELSLRKTSLFRVVIESAVR